MIYSRISQLSSRRPGSANHATLRRKPESSTSTLWKPQISLTGHVFGPSEGVVLSPYVASGKCALCGNWILQS